MCQDDPKKDEKTPSSIEILAKNRMIWLNQEVNDKIMGDIVSRMLVLSAEDPEADIYLLINSPGGSVTAGVMLYDIMHSIPNDVVTVALGMAASMGQYLLTSGAPGKRYIAKNARVLLHQPHGGFRGTSTDVLIEADLIESMKNQLAQATADRTGKTLEEIHEAGDRDAWYTAPEALEFGFVDHIIDNINDVLPKLVLDEDEK